MSPLDTLSYNTTNYRYLYRIQGFRGAWMKPVNETEQPGVSTELSTSAYHKASMAPRWLAIIAVLSIGIIYAFLPSKLRVIEPNWLLLVVEAVVLLPLILIHRRLNHHTI